MVLADGGLCCIDEFDSIRGEWIPVQLSCGCCALSLVRFFVNQQSMIEPPFTKPWSSRPCLWQRSPPHDPSCCVFRMSVCICVSIECPLSTCTLQAGLVCKLNTRATVFAACNPKGKYDPQTNILCFPKSSNPCLSWNHPLSLSQFLDSISPNLFFHPLVLLLCGFVSLSL